MTAAILGREHPAGLLRAEIDRAIDSHGSLVLVAGEAGIGKTTLVTGAAEVARQRGALVLSGSCWDSTSAPGYWPWVQVLRALRRSIPPEEWAKVLDEAGGVLAVLLGESAGREPTDGFLLYDAVTNALVTAAQRRPLVIVLDDLHWADPASLRLLEFVARHSWFERLLLIGTYRDVEVEAPGHPLQPLMAPLLSKCTPVTLTGLGPGEVAALMAHVAGREPEPELVAEVHRRTGGNPFFVEQTARLWHSGGSVTAVAPGVRDALRRRLAQLPDPVAELLTTAAVLGRQFHRQVLAAVAARPAAEVDGLLARAVAARLITVDADGTCTFAHDLVREALVGALTPAEAARRHAAVVCALDATAELADLMLPADLARHAYLAGDQLPAGRAVEVLQAAARDAGARLAGEEAVGHLRRALDRAGGGDPRRWVRLALELANALHMTNEPGAASELFDEVASVVRPLGDPALLARLALTAYGTADHGELAPGVVDLLREAHAALVGSTGRSAGPPTADRLVREVSVRAAVLARRAGDDEALVASLWSRHHVLWGLGTATERIALTDELITVARRLPDLESEHHAASFRWVALLERGDPAYLDQYREFVALAERTGRPRSAFSAHIDQSIISTLHGRFAEAETLLERAVRRFGGHSHPYFGYIVHHLRWAALLAQGRFGDLDQLPAEPEVPGRPRPGLAESITAVERGDTATALRHVRLVGDDPEPYPRDLMPLWLRLLARTAAATGDPALIERARAALSPYAGQWLVALHGCDVSGPVDLWLGLLDLAQRRVAEAVDRLSAAHRSADRLRAAPWSVRIRIDLAEALLARDAAGDRAAAAALLDEAEGAAVAIGMRHIPDQARRIRSGVAPQRATSTASAGEFRRDGPVWCVGLGGRAVHVPDAKGLRDLHLLLSRPGTDVPAVRMLDPAGGEVVLAAHAGGADPILDDEARVRYRRHLLRLDEEIDRAAARGDDRRAVALEEERQALLDELRAAAGLGGRSRRLGDTAERARKTVTARIRDSLRKLDRQHPELAAHLRASVYTGMSCRYQPDREITWRL